ncbi:fimbrin-like protein 2-like [Trifolium medium]|uniref:Fimbrin-like protein 2-like n=1 Tax=Trifolium medium TaxID=97028 RepID=A0A392QCH7_9FABA|nr:fimbrin-like protein 2-like [Trifolium medium]
MILTLTASIMYWSLQHSEESFTPEASPVASADAEHQTEFTTEVSNLAIDDDVSENKPEDEGVSS